jgi:hypothetical protein
MANAAAGRTGLMQGTQYAAMSAQELSALADDLLLLQGSKRSTHARTAPHQMRTAAGKQPPRRPQPPPPAVGAPPPGRARPSTARPAGRPVDITAGARASTAPGPVQPRAPAPPERVDAFKRTASDGKARNIRIEGERACGRVRAPRTRCACPAAPRRRVQVRARTPDTRAHPSTPCSRVGRRRP